MKKQIAGVLSAGLLSFGMVSSADAAFLSRLGGQAYYDDQLDVTWTTNANINGRDTWDNQVAWAAGLTVDG